MKNKAFTQVSHKVVKHGVNYGRRAIVFDLSTYNPIGTKRDYVDLLHMYKERDVLKLVVIDARGYSEHKVVEELILYCYYFEYQIELIVDESSSRLLSYDGIKKTSNTIDVNYVVKVTTLYKVKNITIPNGCKSFTYTIVYNRHNNDNFENMVKFIRQKRKITNATILIDKVYNTNKKDVSEIVIDRLCRVNFKCDILIYEL